MKKFLSSSENASSSKIKFENSEDSESSSGEEEAEIEQELADIPFEELQRARSDGTLALHHKRGSEQKTKRANKNRPMELSSKRPVKRYREVVQVPKRVVRDPRFESLCGDFDEEGFKKRYNFMYEQNLPAEKAELKKALNSTKDSETMQELKKRLTWIDKQLKPDPSRRRDTQILTEHKKKEREAAKQGKRPFYLKKSEIRKQSLVEKYNNLKAAGKLDSYMEKRRRRNAAKDHRFMPYRRSENEQ